jgi:hypothetical protein
MSRPVMGLHYLYYYIIIPKLSVCCRMLVCFSLFSISVCFYCVSYTGRFHLLIPRVRWLYYMWGLFPQEHHLTVSAVRETIKETLSIFEAINFVTCKIICLTCCITALIVKCFTRCAIKCEAYLAVQQRIAFWRADKILSRICRQR